MAPQETTDRLPPSWSSPVESRNLAMETKLSFGQKLKETHQDYFEWEDMSIFLQLDTALGTLTETTPGDRTMPGKLIAQENSINEKIKALQGEQKTPEAIRAILDTAILECKEEQARTKAIQVKTEVVEIKTEVVEIKTEADKENISNKEQLEKSKVEAEEDVTEAKESDAEAKESDAEKEKNKARESAKINTAEIEKLLGKAGGIEKIIGSEYNALLKTAIAERKAENPALSDEELKTEARTQIFLNKRAEIEKACPDAKDALEALEKSAIILEIPHPTTKEPIPNARIINETIKNDFSFSEGKTVIRKWNELIAQASDGSKEIWNLSERPPTKRIELNGVSIESKTRYKPNFEYLTMKSETETKISSLKGTIKKGEGHLEGLSKMASKLEIAIQKKDTPKESVIDPTIAQEYGIDITSNDDKEGKIKLTDVQKEIQETQTHLDRLQMELEKAEEFLAVIEKDESHRVSDYQTAMKTETDSHRSNLRFLSSTYLDTILGQSGIDALIRSANAHIDSFPGIPATMRKPINLGEPWDDIPQKQLLAEAIERLAGSQLFKRNGELLGRPIQIQSTISEGQNMGALMNKEYIRNKLGLKQWQVLDALKIEAAITKNTVNKWGESPDTEKGENTKK